MKKITRFYDVVCNGEIQRKAVSFSHVKDLNFYNNIEKSIRELFHGKGQVKKIDHKEKFIALAYD